MKKMILTCLAVLIAAAPLAAAENQSGDAGDGRLKIEWQEVEGANGYEVEIKNSLFRTVRRERVAGTALLFSLPRGDYRIRIGALNKFEKVGNWSDWFDFKVEVSAAPVIETISTATARAGTSEQGLTVTGRNMFEGAVVYLERGKRRIEARNIAYVSPEKITFDLDFHRARGGSYDLVIINADGARGVKEGFFTVEGRGSVTDYQAGPFRFGVGMPYVVLFPEWSTRFENTYTAANAVIGLDLTVFPGARTIPFLKDISCDIDFSYMRFKGRNVPDTAHADIDLLLFCGGLSYNTHFAFPVNLLARMGAGITQTRVIEDAPSTRPYHSQVIFIKTGVSAEWTFLEYCFVEAGADFIYILYSGEHMKMFAPFVRVGVRL
jgi:hypothetical protein